jgi:hypothetical protein
VDALFNQIEAWKGEKQWKTVLDAGTGEHSLRWLFGIPSESLTAITASSQRAIQLNELFKEKLRSQDCILHGNWLNQYFLQNRTYDIVLADYLLGAIEGFAPYFQEHLFSRLRKHCKKTLFIIGQEPFPENSNNEGGQLVVQISRLRDACILLAGHRCYREYPKTWVINNLHRNGFKIVRHNSIPIRIGKQYMHRQLNVCQNKLTFFSDRSVAREMLFHIETLKQKVILYDNTNGKFSFGQDYVIEADVIR